MKRPDSKLTLLAVVFGIRFLEFRFTTLTSQAVLIRPEIKEIFNRTVDTGIEHGTVMVLDHGEGYEVTTFRTESTYQDFRRPDHVTFVRSLDEDLKRRDLTINALAMDADGNVVDLFHGLDDLKNKIIRAVGNSA